MPESRMSDHFFTFLGYTFIGACLLTFFLIIALIGAIYTVLGWKPQKDIEPQGR